MSENLDEITLGENVLRLEHIKLPNGNTYILGCSFEEAQEIYQVLSENIGAVNTDVEDLKTENVTLKNRVTALETELANLRQVIEDKYMAYYDVDATKGIGENNTYSTTQP